MRLPVSTLPKKTVYIVSGIYLFSFLFFLLIEKSWIDTLYHFPVHNGGDSGGYFLLAKNLIKNYTFSYSANPPFVLESLRSPGYPLFISIIISIFRLPEIISIIQLICSFCTGWLVYDLLKEKVSERWSLVGAYLFWINPTVLFYSITALSDTLFVFLEVIIFWIIWKKRSIRSSLVAFLLLGFAALVRPAGSYLGIILVAWMIFIQSKERSIKEITTRVILVTLMLLCVVTPWMYRNQKAFGNFEISSVGPYTLLFYDMEALKESQGYSREAIEAQWLAEIGAPSREAVSSSLYSKKTMNVFMRELFLNIKSYSVFEAKGIMQFFLGSGISDVSQNTRDTNAFLSTYHLEFSIPLLAWAERIFMLIITILFFFSPFLLYTDKKNLLLVLGSGAIALYMAIVVGPIPNPRYRLAALPFILIPAILSVSILTQTRIHTSKRSE